uniref:hypothetical protein n=1 Tax=Vibrio chagasii TaxID=170679 RepID=UPI0035BE9B46
MLIDKITDIPSLNWTIVVISLGSDHLKRTIRVKHFKEFKQVIKTVIYDKISGNLSNDTRFL